MNTQALNPGVPVTEVGQLLLALIVVVGAIFALGWLARRLRGLTRRRDGVLQLIDEMTIGPKHRLVLLQARGSQLLIGISDHGIVLLKSDDKS